MISQAEIAMTERCWSIASDHERIYTALYKGCAESFCPARSRLIRAILRERTAGLLCNDAFDNVLSVAADPRRRDTVFSLFNVALPQDKTCA